MNMNRYEKRIIFICCKNRLLLTFFLTCMLFTIFDGFKSVYSANLIYSENFNDKKIDQPSVGSMTVYKNFQYKEIFPPEYNLTSVGRGGSGYCFSGAQNTSAYIMWNYNQSWPTDEMYVSFWQRFANYTYTDSNENFKIFYPHWGKAYLAAVVYKSGTLSVKTKNSQGVQGGDTGGLTPDSRWISVANQTNGSWHHYEFWMKFSSGKVKIWYDGKLMRDSVLSEGTWNRFNGYLTLGSSDAEEPGKFLRQYDDWEVWDGMPSGTPTSGTPAPPPPTPTPTPTPRTEPDPPTGLKVVGVN